MPPPCPSPHPVQAKPDQMIPSGRFRPLWPWMRGNNTAGTKPAQRANSRQERRSGGGGGRCEFLLIPPTPATHPPSFAIFPATEGARSDSPEAGTTTPHLTTRHRLPPPPTFHLPRKKRKEAASVTLLILPSVCVRGGETLSASLHTQPASLSACQSQQNLFFSPPPPPLSPQKQKFPLPDAKCTRTGTFSAAATLLPELGAVSHPERVPHLPQENSTPKRRKLHRLVTLPKKSTGAGGGGLISSLPPPPAHSFTPGCSRTHSTSRRRRQQQRAPSSPSYAPSETTGCFPANISMNACPAPPAPNPGCSAPARGGEGGAPSEQASDLFAGARRPSTSPALARLAGWVRLRRWRGEEAARGPLPTHSGASLAPHWFRPPEVGPFVRHPNAPLDMGSVFREVTPRLSAADPSFCCAFLFWNCLSSRVGKEGRESAAVVLSPFHAARGGGSPKFFRLGASSVGRRQSRWEELTGSLESSGDTQLERCASDPHRDPSLR